MCIYDNFSYLSAKFKQKFLCCIEVSTVCTPCYGSSDKKGIESAAEKAGWDIK